MGRKRVNAEEWVARFPDGTKARIEAALAPGETRTAFVQTAVEREIKRRERAKP